MKTFIILTITILFFSCNLENKKEENKHEKHNELSFSTNQQGNSNETELKMAVLYEGDTQSYERLDIAFLDYSFQEEFLIYALIMANKYDYPQAYFDVYVCLTNVFSDISEIDEATANLAISYLLKAKDKGHHQANDIVEKHNISSTENSKQYLEEIYKE
jgi:hypothetical protein